MDVLIVILMVLFVLVVFSIILLYILIRYRNSVEDSPKKVRKKNKSNNQRAFHFDHADRLAEPIYDPDAPVVLSSEAIGRLKMLHDLFEKGIVSRADYEQQKQDILEKERFPAQNVSKKQ